MRPLDVMENKETISGFFGNRGTSQLISREQVSPPHGRVGAGVGAGVGTGEQRPNLVGSKNNVREQGILHLSISIIWIMNTFHYWGTGEQDNQVSPSEGGPGSICYILFNSSTNSYLP